MNFKNYLFLLVAVIGLPSMLVAKNIYIKYTPSCMDRYEYRLNDNNKGNGLISYYVRDGKRKTMILEAGVESIAKVKRMPSGTRTCSKVKIDELFVNAINSGKDKVYIVRPIGAYYTVSPVHLATLITESSDGFAMKGNELDMTWQNADIGVMENNLSSRYASTRVFFLGTTQSDCKEGLRFKKIPEETCKPYTDLTFIPGIGITEERTGFNDAEAAGNIIRLVKINNIPLEKYISQRCKGSEPEPPLVENQPEPAYQPSTTTTPDAEKKAPEPTFEVVFENTPPQPEYTPAGAELLYNYNEPQPTIEVFQPKGADCKKLAYQGVHIVQTGETLYSIARRHSITLSQLRQWNQLGKSDLIKACQSLYVLPPESVAANTTSEDGPLPKSAEIVIAHNPSTTPASSTAPTPSTRAKGAPTTSGATILYPAKEAGSTEEVTTKTGLNPCNLLAEEGKHIVQKGETLYSIGKKYGVTVQQLEYWNKLNPGANIQPCMSLFIRTPQAVEAAKMVLPAKDNKTTYTIPSSDISPAYTNAPANTAAPKGTVTVMVTDKMWNSGIEYHIVQKGETLAGLARMYGFTLERFKDINGLTSDQLKIGQVLRTGSCLCPVSQSADSFISKGVPSTTAESTIDKGINRETETAVRERTNVNTPVPAPYNYEAESMIIQTRKADKVTRRNGRKVHTVGENETLAMIAGKYNISVEQLRKINNMEKNEIVIPYQKIYLE